MSGWRASDIPSLAGKRAVVTGANSGVGFHTALELARAGATVVLAARDPSRGAQAVRRVQRAVPHARAEFAALDLADFASVRRFAAEHGAHPVDILVNNAGVMALPRHTSANGFEVQFATNHLGHFALTGLLLPALLQRRGARVVTVSSIAHWMASMDFDDLMGERNYQPWTAYAQSKLANLLFMRQLHHEVTAAGVELVSAAAHPGITSSNLYAARGMSRMRSGLTMIAPLVKVVGQSPAKGALPQLYAATAPGVRGGDYFGPRGPAELRGRPQRVRMSKNANDEKNARLLWDISEELTGVRYMFSP